MIRVSLSDAAEAAGVLPATIRQWVLRGNIPPPQDGRWFDLEAIEDYSYRRDHGRDAGAALSGRRRRGETRRPAA